MLIESQSVTCDREREVDLSGLEGYHCMQFL